MEKVPGSNPGLVTFITFNTLMDILWLNQHNPWPKGRQIQSKEYPLHSRFQESWVISVESLFLDIVRGRLRRKAGVGGFGGGSELS